MARPRPPCKRRKPPLLEIARTAVHPCRMAVKDGPERSLAERKRLGAWYTPDGLAMRIVRRAASLVDGPIRNILDPSSGAGAFLVAAAAIVPGARLCGVDADPLARAACQERAVGAQVVVGDSLLAEDEGGIAWTREFPEAAAAGGFDLVVGNPPWEVLEAAAHQGRHSRRAYADALRRSGAQVFATGAKINLYRVAIVRAFEHLRPGGVLAFVVPGGLLRDASSEDLRAFLLDAGEWSEVWELETGAALFPTAHRELSCCVVFVRKGRPTAQLCVRAAGSGTPVLLDRAVLDRLGAPDRSIPALASEAELDLMARLWRLPKLADCVGGIRKGDVNLTTDRELFCDHPTALALRTGKEIGPYRVPGGPRRWVDPERFGKRAHPERVRVAWRDIADRALRKRMCAAMLPPHSVLADTLNFLVLSGDEAEVAYFVALLNSHVFEWAVRRRSAHNHLGKRIVGPCPVVPYQARDTRCRQIAALATQAEQSAAAAIRADAAVAHHYGLSQADLTLILEGFPKQPYALKEAILGAFDG